LRGKLHFFPESFQRLESRVARWYIIKTKMAMWENIEGSCNGRWPFGKFYGHLVYFTVIWYIFPRFGMLHREKSGNRVINRNVF
jgi:hypothetical protein